MISIDRNRCYELSNFFSSLIFQENHFKRKELVFNADKETKLMTWFTYTSICHNTRGLGGYIDSIYFRGWDYLSRKFISIAETNPEFFSVDSLATLTEDEFGTIMADDKGTRSLTFVDERRKMLNDLASEMLTHFDGSILNMFDNAKGYLVNDENTGLYQLLSKFKVYNDAERKKSTVFLMLPYEAKLVSFKDMDNLEPIVDYHMMRGLLRIGAIDVDEKTKISLSIGEKDSLLEKKIRSQSKEAVRIIAQKCNKNFFEMNWIMWNLFRSCCYTNARCSSCDIEESYEKYCSFEKTFNFKCKGSCPLASYCKGAQDTVYRELREPNVDTTFY